MLNQYCLVRSNTPKEAPVQRQGDHAETEVSGGWRIHHQNWDTRWEIQLSSKAYKAYKAGDLVFDTQWGTPNPFWETEVEVLFKESE